MKLPSAGGEPATDLPAAVDQALSACRQIDSMTAEIAVTGSIGGRRVRARLIGGFTPPATRLEAAAPAGPPFFIFVANGRDATLLLPRDDRVLERGRADEVLEAIAGVRLGPSELLQTLTGCPQASRPSAGVAIGDAWRMWTTDTGSKVYLHRESVSSPWQVAAVLHSGEGGSGNWRADYGDFHDGLPHSVHLVSTDAARFDIHLQLSQIETGQALGGDVFRVQIPASAQPITIEELRRSGPVGQRGDGR
jgi:hypothetical protein